MNYSVTPAAFPETNLTWLRPRLLRQPVSWTTLDDHCFKRCDLSEDVTQECYVLKRLHLGIFQCNSHLP